MTKETTDDPGGTADATTEGEDLEVETTATEATEASGTATETWTTPEPGSADDREPRGNGYAGRSYGDRQSGRGYNRGYGRGPNYGDQDARRIRDSSVEPGGRMNGAMEHDGRPPFRYNSLGSTPQRRDSSVGRVT